MLFYRGIFQNLTWNRLIRHQLIYVNQHNRRQIHNDSVGCSHQLACSKNDVITHNDHIQQLQNDEPLQPNSSEFKTKKVLPFEAIPCAEKPHSYGTLPRLIYRCRQLLTAKWGNKFHEEIDECHRRLGPIFRKSLGHNQSGKHKQLFFVLFFSICFSFKNLLLSKVIFEDQKKKNQLTLILL